MSDAPAYRDRLPAPEAAGEPVLATFAADPGAYWRAHLALAAVAGCIVALLLWAIGRGGTVWAGIAGTFAAIALRGVLFRREALAVRWLLTPTALIGPGGERIDRGAIRSLRHLMGDVQVVAGDGRTRLIRHLADPRGAIAAIRGLR